MNKTCLNDERFGCTLGGKDVVMSVGIHGLDKHDLGRLSMIEVVQVADLMECMSQWAMS
jgi:hypothetical protein